MEALIDDVNGVPLNMVVVVVVDVDDDDDDDSFDTEDHQTEVNVHLNKINWKLGVRSLVLQLPAVLCNIEPPGVG